MSLRKPSSLLILAVAPLVACGGGGGADQPPATTAPAPAAQTGTASIAGKVTYSGAAPEVELVKMTADPKCKELHPDGLERAAFDLAEDGGVGGVLVYVKGVSGSFPAPSAAASLDQNGCAYSPRMLAVMAGQDLKITNSDATLHNIHPRPKNNEEFNVGQPRQGMETTRSFSKAELMIPVGCDVHPWMRAYISVFEHPFFAVTGADGSFSIGGLPAGDYEVEALHPTLDATSGRVSLGDGQAGSLDLGYGAAPDAADGGNGAADEGARDAEDAG
jgi:plastocyanin